MEHNLSNQELLLAVPAVNWEQLRAAGLFEQFPNFSSAAHSYFAFPAFGKTATREVTCCPFSIPPTITNSSGRTIKPR
jgi:hypothetical protein